MSQKSIQVWIILAVALFLTVGVFIWALGPARYILLFAFAAAYLTRPLFVKLEKHGLNRTLAVSLLFMGVIVVGALGLFFLVPYLIDQAKSLSFEVPQIAARLMNRLNEILSTYGLDLHLDLNAFISYVSQNFQSLVLKYTSPALGSVGHLMSGALAFILSLLNLLLFPVFFFFCVRDFEPIVAFLDKFIPHSLRPKFEHYLQVSNEVLAGFLRGQVLVVLCVSVIYAVGFSFVGIRFGLLLGLIAGLFTFIPYVGASLAVLGSLTLAFADSSGWATYLGIAIVIAIEQSIESFVLTPRLVGHRVGLSPLATLLAIIVGGNLFGFFGMLIAIPAGAIMKLLIKELVASYQAAQ